MNQHVSCKPCGDFQKRIKIVKIYLEDNKIYDEKIDEALLKCSTNDILDDFMQSLSTQWEFDVEELAISHYWIALYAGWVEAIEVIDE